MGLFKDLLGMDEKETTGKSLSQLANPPEPISDFKTFLTWVNDIELYSETMLIKEDRVISFINTLLNPFVTSVSGSALLAHRQDKKPFGKDIDIFIDCSVSDNIKVVEEFADFLGNEEMRPTFANAENDYPFMKGIASLQTRKYEVKLEKETFILNFIFLDYKDKESEKIKTLSHNQLLCENLGRIQYSFRVGKLMDGEGTTFSSDGGAQDDLNVTIYGGTVLPITFIVDNFDFEELKFIWDFKAKEAITTFMMSQRLITTILLSIESDTNVNPYKVTLSLAKLSKELQRGIDANVNSDLEFISNFGEDDTLTLSEGITQDLGTKYNSGNSMEFFKNGVAILPLADTSAMTRALTMIRRMTKYTDYGYKIKDPRGITVSLLFGMSASLLTVLEDKTFNKAMRSSVIGQDNKNIPKQYQFVSALKRLVSPFWKEVTNVDTLNAVLDSKRKD